MEADGEAVDLVVADLAAAAVEDLVDSVVEVQVEAELEADGRIFIGIVNIEKAGPISPAFLIGTCELLFWSNLFQHIICQFSFSTCFFGVGNFT